MRRFAELTGLFATMTIVVSACGGGATTSGRPSIDFDGVDHGKQETGSGDIASDGEPEADAGNDSTKIDLVEPAEVVPEIVDIDQPDAPVSCEPGERHCDGLEIVRCDADGKGYSIIKSCEDGNPCTDDYCEDGKCLYETPDGSCCHPACGMGLVCVQGDCVCVRMCFGKQCGDDGCGGTCGDCPSNHICTSSGTCSCIPQCEGKQCGDDQCGGDCGPCPIGNVCEADQCICIPNCEGKICGNDGCGGTCGACAAHEECVDNACKFTCPTCPSIPNCNRALNETNYRAYYYCVDSKKWSDARDYCAGKAAFLTDITSAEENTFVAALLPTSSSAWIGLSQDWGKWKWTNGSEASYTAWGPGQPDDGSIWTTEDCVETAQWALWNDLECGEKRPFVCELIP